MRRLVIEWTLTLAFALVSASAAAQAGGGDARTMFQRGQTAYAQGDYDTAIDQWSRAYELDPRPLLQFNLSQAHERLGNLPLAIAALERYLEGADANDEHQADARARLSALRERLGRTSIHVVGGPEGAILTIDDEDRGRTPRPDPIAVSPGSHRVVVRAPGYEEFTSTVAVSAGQSVEVAVSMAAIATAEETSGELPIVPIILFSTGGAALIAGAVMGGIALSDAQNAPSRTSPEADAARGLALGADITMGIGVAAAAAGLIVLLVSDSGSSEQPEAVSVVPWGSEHSFGVAARARF